MERQRKTLDHETSVLAVCSLSALHDLEPLRHSLLDSLSILHTLTKFIPRSHCYRTRTIAQLILSTSRDYVIQNKVIPISVTPCNRQTESHSQTEALKQTFPRGRKDISNWNPEQKVKRMGQTE